MSPLDWMDAEAASAPSSAPRDASGAGGCPEELLEGLNEPQLAAVTSGEGPLLILAGAGSGKTRVITRRIAWLVATGRAQPHEVLAITFTNKAAREMRERVEQVLPVKGLWIGTFHATCARILRRDIETLGAWTRDFSIYDTHDRNQLLKTLIKDCGYDVKRFRPALVGSWISEEKREAAESQGAELVPEGGEGIEAEVLRRVSRRYAEAMRANNALDFDDLLLVTLRLFERHPGVRDAYAHRFRYVLADEYQDTNRVQYLLTRHFASLHGNLAVCGDPDQSIYAWRGADIRNILAFEEDYRDRDVHVVKLEQNYRSTGNILRAAQAVIAHNVGRKEKDLWTEQPDGERITVVECGDENDEATEIAGRIRSLIAGGEPADSIAVFYRVNFMQRALERALRLTGVPYQVVGGVEFYQRREVRDLISYLTVIANPRDDVACQRIVNVPARGIGDTSLARVASFAAERGLSLTAAVGMEESRAVVRGRARKGLAALAGLLEQLAPLADAPAAEALDRVIEETQYFEWLKHLADDDLETREENVEELRTHAETYDRDHPEGKLRGFLQDVALVSDVDGWQEDEPRVAMLTLHSSKGLEFKSVFLAGAEEELLPHALALVEGDDGEEEERRLFYVGVTRAQQRLVLTWARTRLHFGQTSWRNRSRFLDELPRDLVDGADADESEDEVLGSYEAPSGLAGADELHEGAIVEHEHFGRGRVDRLQGAGANARATVSFSAHGSKVLLVQYAHLRVVGG
jgi:DNA helicase-2/ATP-dependent DNA helicase PcrA